MGTAKALATDPDRQVRGRLAANRACPGVVLVQLFGDRQFHVRWYAAENPSATAALGRTPAPGF